MEGPGKKNIVGTLVQGWTQNPCLAAGLLGVMNRLRNYLPQRILQILYNSLILPHLNRNITACGFASHKLYRLQKRALMLITDSRYNTHTQPLFKALGTLTLDDTFKMQCLKYYYKCIQGKLPPFVNTFFIEKKYPS